MSSVTNSKSRPGLDHDTDHILVQAKVRLKTYKCQASKIATKHDLEKLEDDKIRADYTVATENRFEILLQTVDDDKTPDELLNSVKEIYLSVADEILGKKKKKKSNRGLVKSLLSYQIRREKPALQITEWSM